MRKRESHKKLQLNLETLRNLTLVTVTGGGHTETTCPSGTVPCTQPDTNGITCIVC